MELLAEKNPGPSWKTLGVDRRPPQEWDGQSGPGWSNPSKVTSLNPGGGTLLANEDSYRRGYGPPPKRPAPTILSQFRNEFDRAQWNLREEGGRWPEGRDPSNPPLVSSFQRPNPVVQPAYRGAPSQSELDPKRCNREALTEAGRRMFNQQACQVPRHTEAPSPYLCPQEVTWQATWVGTPPMFIPIEDSRCANPGCPPSGRWEKIYRNPQEWNEIYYKRALEDGRRWNPYEHLDNRQKMLQFLTSDFAGAHGDPYTVPVTRPNPGVQTLAEARLAERIPRPGF